MKRVESKKDPGNRKSVKNVQQSSKKDTESVKKCEKCLTVINK